jgi:hypothetical protein
MTLFAGLPEERERLAPRNEITFSQRERRQFVLCFTVARFGQRAQNTTDRAKSPRSAAALAADWIVRHAALGHPKRPLKLIHRP